MADVGKLRERVTLQTRSAGAGPVSWSNSAPTWVEVTAQAFAEGTTASGLRSTTQYLVRLRDRALTPSQRIVWRGKTLQIVGVRPHETRGYIEALCVETA